MRLRLRQWQGSPERKQRSRKGRRKTRWGAAGEGAAGRVPEEAGQTALGQGSWVGARQDCCVMGVLR